MRSWYVWLFSLLIVFFFKQKTAYEMRISDWSSDVCSSDLPAVQVVAKEAAVGDRHLARPIGQRDAVDIAIGPRRPPFVIARKFLVVVVDDGEIGRASCRERVCQYV